MINGQHRKDVYQTFWNDDITLDGDFPTIGKHTDVEGFSWGSFDEQEQLSLLAAQHLVVIVEKFKTMSNLKGRPKKAPKDHPWLPLGPQKAPQSLQVPPWDQFWSDFKGTIVKKRSNINIFWLKNH